MDYIGVNAKNVSPFFIRGPILAFFWLTRWPEGFYGNFVNFVKITKKTRAQVGGAISGKFFGFAPVTGYPPPLAKNPN